MKKGNSYIPVSFINLKFRVIGGGLCIICLQKVQQIENYTLEKIVIIYRAGRRNSFVSCCETVWFNDGK